MSLTKADIVERIFKGTDFSKKEASELVEQGFSIIKQTLSDGEMVKISGFGKFSIKDKAARTGRNPQTGEAMEISARRVLTFKPSHSLKDDVTSRNAHRLSPDGKEDASIPSRPGTSRALGSFADGHEESDSASHGQADGEELSGAYHS